MKKCFQSEIVHYSDRRRGINLSRFQLLVSLLLILSAENCVGWFVFIHKNITFGE